MHQQAPHPRAGATDIQVDVHRLATVTMDQTDMGNEAKPQGTSGVSAELGDERSQNQEPKALPGSGHHLVLHPNAGGEPHFPARKCREPRPGFGNF